MDNRFAIRIDTTLTSNFRALLELNGMLIYAAHKFQVIFWGNIKLFFNISNLRAQRTRGACDTSLPWMSLNDFTLFRYQSRKVNYFNFQIVASFLVMIGRSWIIGHFSAISCRSRVKVVSKKCFRFGFFADKVSNELIIERTNACVNIGVCRMKYRTTTMTC